MSINRRPVNRFYVVEKLFRRNPFRLVRHKQIIVAINFFYRNLTFFARIIYAYFVAVTGLHIFSDTLAVDFYVSVP